MLIEHSSLSAYFRHVCGVCLKRINRTDSRLSPVDKIIPIPISILSFEKGGFVDSLNVKYLIRRQQNTNYITKISDFPIAIRTLKITVD